MPRAFRVGSDGSTTVNTDYFTNVELTSESPQVVTYTINPKAVWSDGTPITWEDIASQINSTSGKNKDFHDRQPQRQRPRRKGDPGRGRSPGRRSPSPSPIRNGGECSPGNTMLLPKSMTANPEVFNKGQLDRPGPSAGPFMVTSLDRTAQRITLTRNPKWWGTPPLLDSITYLVLDDAALIPALQNNTIDATGVTSLPELTTARNTPASRSGARPARAGITSRSTGRKVRSSRTRRYGWRSPRASTGRPSPM